MNTVLVVTTDSALRNRVQRSLGTFSVFEAASDAEGIKTLRLVDIDLVLRESAGPSGALSTFVASVRDVAPAALTIAIGAAGEEETAADFTVPDGFTSRELDAVLRQAVLAAAEHLLALRRLEQERRHQLQRFRLIPKLLCAREDRRVTQRANQLLVPRRQAIRRRSGRRQFA